MADLVGVGGTTGDYSYLDGRIGATLVDCSVFASLLRAAPGFMLAAWACVVGWRAQVASCLLFNYCVCLRLECVCLRSECEKS